MAGSEVIPAPPGEAEIPSATSPSPEAAEQEPKSEEAPQEEESPEERRKLEQQLLEKQATLQALLTRIQAVKSEHDKLEGENKFLQSYIGELMSTSKIISTGAAKGGKGGKGR